MDNQKFVEFAKKPSYIISTAIERLLTGIG